MKADRSKKWYAFKIVIILSISSILYFLLRHPSHTDDKFVTLLTKEKGYFVPLKIQGYSSSEIPYLEMTIENKPVTVSIDLGCEGMISLPSNIIHEVKKKEFIERIRTYGIRGKAYENDVYKVEEVNIEDISFFSVRVEQIDLAFEKDTLMIGTEDPLESNFGRIGWPLFYKMNLLVDCKNSKLALCDSLKTLEQEGYPIKSFTETSFLLDHGFIEFEVLTELGMLRCILDTGATWNLLNKDLRNECNDRIIFTGKKGEQSLLNPENKDLLIFNPDDTQKFSNFNMGGKDFGPITFDCMKSPVPVDAILGMEFFHSTLVFIDFANRKIYFYAYPLEEEVATAQSITKTDVFVFLKLLSPHSQFSIYKAPLSCSNRFQSPVEGVFFRWRALTNHRP